MSSNHKVTCVYIVKDGHIDLDNINEEIEKPEFLPDNHDNFGGLWMGIVNIWLKSKTDYVCYLPYGYSSSEDRFKIQIEEFNKDKDLSACYSDVSYFRKGQKSPYKWEDYCSFESDMIGTDAIPLESILIDRKKFLNAGGFDYALSGSKAPHQYLSTMLACSGRIKHIKGYLVNCNIDKNDPLLRSDLFWQDEETKGMWERLNIDRFTMRARKFYKEMRW